MADLDRLAQSLFGGRRAETQEVSTDATTRTYMGVATTDSEDGTAYVSIEGDVTLPDDIVDPDGNVIESYEDNGVEMAVGPSVSEGDEVIVTLVGGGPLKTPMVTSVSGEGDRQNAAIASAEQAAATAWDHADDANDAAIAAQSSADTASHAASNALNQVSIVEDVAGTLTWIRDHGTFTLTTDTSIVDGRVYFALVDGDYVPIVHPSGNPSAQGWYVLDVTDSQTDYIMAHLAVTSAGLWVLPGGIGEEQDARYASGYKLLLASDGAYLYDGDGHLVVTYGESITLDAGRPQYIGGEQAYIVFTPESGANPATVTIGGNVVMGTGESLTELLGAVTYDHTFTESNGTYTFRAYAYKGGIDITSQLDPDFFGWWLRTESGDEWLGSGVTRTVQASAAGYRASVVGGLLDTLDVGIADSGGNAIVDASGNEIIAHWIRSDG